MGIIKYDENTMLNAKSKIDTCNEKILQSLNKIYEETSTISNVLSTPKSNKNMEEMIIYLKNRINYVDVNKAGLNRKIDIVEASYREEFMTAVGQMVGGNNG